MPAGPILRSLGETAFAVSPWAPSPAPVRTGEVDAAFLERVFAPQAPGARVEAIEYVDRHSGTTDRQPLRVTWNAAGRDAGLPDRLFAKGTPVSVKSRVMVASLDMAVNEVRFYQRAASDLPGIAPEAHAAHAGRGGRHLLLLEDVVASGGHAYLLADDCPIDHARAVMQTLGRVHGTFTGSPRLTSDLAFAQPMTARPGAAMLRLTMRRLRNWFLKAPDERPLPEPVTRLLELVQRNDKAVYRLFERGPQTLLHGDSHLGNTFSRADGTAGLLDWQVVWRGPGLREIAYFIGTSLETDLRREHERELLGLYLHALEEAGAEAPSFDAAWQDYRFSMFDAWDSGSICEMWPGLQTEESVRRSRRLVDAAVEDLEVDRAVAHALATA